MNEVIRRNFLQKKWQSALFSTVITDNEGFLVNDCFDVKRTTYTYVQVQRNRGKKSTKLNFDPYPYPTEPGLMTLLVSIYQFIDIAGRLKMFHIKTSRYNGTPNVEYLYF